MGLFDRLPFRWRGDATPPGSESNISISPQRLNAERLMIVHGKDASAALARYRTESKSTGLIPVILGGAEEVPAIADNISFITEEYGLTTDQTLLTAQTLDVEDWLRKAGKQREVDTADNGAAADYTGKWPVLAPKKTGLTTCRHILTNKFLREVYIGLFRVGQSWEVLASLLWYAINYNMAPDVHVAVHKRWQSLYGSEVISATGDVIQCAVSNPPETKDAAMRLEAVPKT